jgi:hypothetical protein
VVKTYSFEPLPSRRELPQKIDVDAPAELDSGAINDGFSIILQI